MTAFLGYEISLKWCENYTHLHEPILCLSFPTIMSPELSSILEKHNIKPKAVFENLHWAKMRNQAKDCLKDLAGVYIIVNLIALPLSINNILSKRSISTNSNPRKDTSADTLHPDWMTGFVDAKGCFHLWIELSPKSWQVVPGFEILVARADLALLYRIQAFFGGIGHINVRKGGQSASFTVKRVGDIVKHIIPHFIKYPLRSAKSVDFKLWLQCIELIVSKEHLTKEGFKKILQLNSALNLGFSDKLKNAFPYVEKMERPKYVIKSDPLNPNWISGFSAGESCFKVSISKSSAYVTYIVGSNSIDTPLIIKILEYFGEGQIYPGNKDDCVYYRLAKVESLLLKVVPHFDQYPLQGHKSHDYLIWKKILRLVEAKLHLTQKGLSQITQLNKEFNK